MKKIILFVFVIWFQTGYTQTTLSGTVKNGENEPVPGANIFVKGTAINAVTDLKGEFSLSIQTFPITLEVSFVGYKTREIQVSEPPTQPLSLKLIDENVLNEVIVTSRRRKEVVQDIPIPISVIGGSLIEESGAFTVNRVKELIPSVQLYSSNPRNTTLNIRGLGSTFGLTNDGLDPGVGFYVDGVYFARPAATTLDFIDIEQIEVLRGPQGTLFGKNTTSGAFNITTRAPSFKPGGSVEVSYGNYNFVQAKSSLTGPLGKKVALRLSFSGTQRDGLLYNVATQKNENTLNNLGGRLQLLFLPTDNLKITLTGDATRQRPSGFAQVVAGVTPTLRPAYRQFNQIIADLNYSLPSQNPFDRVIDTNTPWRSDNDLGGVSLNADLEIGGGTLTSTTAWRFWDWGPSNDRDFTGLSVLSLSQATSTHQQWSQEIRYAGNFSSSLSGVIGVFALSQDVRSNPVQIEESGSAQWRFSQNSTSNNWKTPGLLDGYGTKTTNRLKSFSGAVFGQIDWAITPQLHLLPGLRYNYDQKAVNFDRQTYGGLQTTDPALIALKNSVYTNQAFVADAQENNLSWQLTLAYKPISQINAFGTYSTSFKPVGVNLGGLPAASGEVLIDLARIKPESVRHFEVGVKTTPIPQATLNLVFHHSNIKNFQTQVQTAEVGVNRGYLANAEEVRVYGLELDGSFKISNLSVYSALTYTEGKYISFTNAPVPLEETGATNAFKDISGGDLPGISRFAGSLGGEFTFGKNFLSQQGKYFLAVDSYYRSRFSSSASPSKYLNISDYGIVNSRLGFRATEGITAFLWVRNLLDKDYFEQLLPAAGSAGHYAGVLGDPRTYGVTVRFSF
ncbi:MAG: TonB-dependent receptor [Verrucomicrobia bacterium]|nr:TonB-dependent receptor [Cytophagales bacterium]